MQSITCINWGSGRYRWDVWGTTQAPPFLLFPILKPIFIFTDSFLDLDPSLLLFLPLVLCQYPKFHKGSPGRLKQWWEENAVLKSKCGMMEKQDPITEI